MGVLLSPGDQVLTADPAYPANRHFVRAMEGESVGIPVDASTGYQLTAELVERHWTERTVGGDGGLAFESDRHAHRVRRAASASTRWCAGAAAC